MEKGGWGLKVNEIITFSDSPWNFRSDDIVDTEDGMENEVFGFDIEDTKRVLGGDIRIIREVSVRAHDSSESVVSHMLDTR